MGKTIRSLYCFLMAGLFSFASPGLVMAGTANVTVAWDPIVGSALAGYTVLWGQASKNYINSQNLGIVTQVTLQLETGKTYYLAVRGFDKQGVAGELSNEISTLVPGTDKGSPVISNLSITSVTASSATIYFDTDKAAYVQAEYGVTTSLGSNTGFSDGASTSHTLTLNNLSSQTTYYYHAVAKDLSGNQGVSGILTFTTKEGSSDPNALKFKQITLSNVGNTSVTINWSTSKAATGLIEYGVGSPSQFDGAETTLTTSHALPLSNLKPSTLYRYQITAQAVDGKQVASGVLMFKTSDRVNQPAQPSPEAIFIPSIVENSGLRTNLGINNLASSTANVNITLVDQQGMVLASKTVQVDPKGLKQINSAARFVYADSLGNEIDGSFYLESDQPICAWASQIDNATNDPSLLLSKHSGTSQILIPSAANIGNFTSSLVLMNVGAMTAQVSLKAYSVSGSVVGQTVTALSVPPNGVLSLENVLQTLGVSNNYGPIEITSLNNVPLIASSRVSSTTKAGGFFEGLNSSEASLLQVIPNVVDSADLRTNLGINNATYQVATVTVRLIDKDGAEKAATQVSVAAKGLLQMNNVVRQLLNQSGLANFEGYIRLESNQPIFGWASIIDNVTNDPGFAEGKGAGSSHLLVESTANVGSFKSSLALVNMGNTAALVDIVSHDATGQINGELRSLVIPARGYFSSDNILERLGVSNNYGPIEITSTNAQPLIATSRVYSTSRTSGFFQGEAVE